MVSSILKMITDLLWRLAVKERTFEQTLILVEDPIGYLIDGAKRW